MNWVICAKMLNVFLCSSFSKFIPVTFFTGNLHSNGFSSENGMFIPCTYSVKQGSQQFAVCDKIQQAKTRSWHSFFCGLALSPKWNQTTRQQLFSSDAEFVTRFILLCIPKAHKAQQTSLAKIVHISLGCKQNSQSPIFYHPFFISIPCSA